MNNDVELCDLAKSIAILICTCRSSSYYYKDIVNRRRYILNFFNDIGLNNILNVKTRKSKNKCSKRNIKDMNYYDLYNSTNDDDELDSRIDVLVRFCSGLMDMERFLDIISIFNTRASENRYNLNKIYNRPITDEEYARRNVLERLKNKRKNTNTFNADNNLTLSTSSSRPSSSGGVVGVTNSIVGNSYGAIKRLKRMNNYDDGTTSSSSSSSNDDDNDDSDSSINEDDRIMSNIIKSDTSDGEYDVDDATSDDLYDDTFDSKNIERYFKDYDFKLFENIINELVFLIKGSELPHSSSIKNYKSPLFPRNDNNIKIEFKKEIDTDYALGITGITDSISNNLYVRPADYIHIASMNGFFNRSVSFGGDSISYKAYLYCSNIIKFDVSIEETNTYSEIMDRVYRKMDISTNKLNIFSKKLTELSNDSVTFKNFSNLDISLQFSFSLNKKLFSITLFYVKSNDPCDNILVIKKEYASNICSCENRTCSWRLCCILNPINVKSINENEQDILEIVTNTFTAFKFVSPSNNSVLHCFTGLLMPNLINDCKTIGCLGLYNDKLETVADNIIESRTCHLHKFTSSNITGNWQMINSTNGLYDLLIHYQRLIIIHRPVTSTQCLTINGNTNKVFTHYKTFNDYFSINIILNIDILINGFKENLKTIAYQAYNQSYLIFKRDNSQRYFSSDVDEILSNYLPENRQSTSSNEAYLIDQQQQRQQQLLLQQRKKKLLQLQQQNQRQRQKQQQQQASFNNSSSSSSSSSSSYYTVDNLYNDLKFKAPSQLYIFEDVLNNMGFNIYASSVKTMFNGIYCRIFEHYDKEADSIATVICSVPLRILDKNGQQIESKDNNILSDKKGLRILKLSDARYTDSPLEPYKSNTRTLDNNSEGIHHKYFETTIDINEFWPGVKLFKLQFKNNSILEKITFVMFLCRRDSTENLKLMSSNNMIGFTKYCSSTNLINPPTLYTFQQMMLTQNV